MTSALLRFASAARSWLRTLLDLRLVGLLALLALGLVALAARPLSYPIAVGRADGRGSDLPFVYGWNTPEVLGGVPVRWSDVDSHIVATGLPPGTHVVELQFLPATANPHRDIGVVGLADGAQPLVAMPLPNRRTSLHLLLPPASALDLRVSAPVWQPPGDPRTLGVLVAGCVLRAIPVAPTIGSSLGLISPITFWPLLGMLLIWPPLRRWVPIAVGFALGLGITLLALLAYWADPLRFVLGARPALVALSMALVLALLLRSVLGRYASGLAVPPSAPLLNSLALIFFGLFALRYGGRIYPASMPGDLGFHVNRQNDVLRGTVLLLSKHRGIDFPYPPALYVLQLPLRLLPLTPEALVEISDALWGALGVFPLAILALRAFRRERAALFAALVYALLAPAIMSLWWSFLPHIFAQELAVLIISGLVVGWPALAERRSIALLAAALAFLWSAHYGYYLNVSLLLVLAGGIALGSPGRERPRLAGIVLAFGLAQVIVLALFYSAFVPLFATQAQKLVVGGMGAVQGGRVALPRSELWRILVRDGLRAHYATVALPVGLLGCYGLLSHRAPRILRWLVAATLALALAQAAMPFVTLSTVTTRWLSFLTWLVAIGSAFCLDALWRRGRAARLLALALVGWIAWTTLWMWIQALAYRIRPPEPF